MTTTHRITTRVVLVLALTGAAVPGAFAHPVRSNGESASNPAPAVYSRQDKSLVPTPDKSASKSGVATAATATAPTTIVHLTAGGSGFDWGDAGIGAAGGIALSMVGVGGALALSQHRGRGTRNPTVPTS